MKTILIGYQLNALDRRYLSGIAAPHYPMPAIPLTVDECICRFIAPGLPMDNGGFGSPRCQIHPASNYRCERTKCDNYKPIGPAIRTADNHLLWRKCVCGAIAQDHN